MATLLLDAGLLVAAPPTLLRHGLLLTLREAWPTCPIHFVADLAQLPRLLHSQAYALLIMDGTALAAKVLPTILSQVRSLRPWLPTLVLTGRRPPVLPVALLPAAAHRLLSHHATPAEVAGAVTELLATAPTLALPQAPCSPHRPYHAGFSPRELEVLALVAADLCNEQIADQLCLSVRTVESHRRALLHKAGVRTPVGLVMRALREGWVEA
ncbi:response regulator transcription factor [Hymenobacter sp. H14-R3]|uniref:helix-turn-helix transcriptional regulator n=1 Tax=Hymenobacter sp. H14-R3 TaxID=3046308 RepID=UPI0024B95066|nr:response regulator transcription factor [Hymenobacter sp. H14-R3]MDJ0364346.1 response regulator transcription factor [Hymenobacter sp. H14-R3]